MLNQIRKASENHSIQLLLLHFLNLFDGVLTLYVLEQGVEEANPLMEYLYTVSPHLFFIFKVVVVSSCLVFLDKYLDKSKRWLITAIFCVYIFVIFWHICGMLILWDGWHSGHI